MSGPDVLFLYSTLTVGGAERQLSVLAPELAARGWRVVVATLRHRGRFYDEIAAAGVETRFANMGSRTDLRGAFRAYRLWRRHPQIVFTQSVDAQMLGAVLARRCGARHVTAEHGGPSIHRPAHHRAGARVVAPRVAAVVAVSESQLPDLLSLGYARDRIRVIENGIPPLTASRTSDEVRRDLGLGPRHLVALFAATLRPEKQVGLFAEAVERAHARDPRIRGVVAGGGPELASLRARLTAGGPVVALGERADVADLMSAADVVCLSSSVEGLPMVVLEAFALGRPVVATAVGGLVAAVGESGAGVLVPPDDPAAYADALVALAADDARRAALGEAARERFEERYSVERMVDEYEELLRGVRAGTVTR